jgi:hypothetical protein
MFCKRCSRVYSLDLNKEQSLFLNCSNCGDEQDVPNYIHITFETIVYINNTMYKMYTFVCK